MVRTWLATSSTLVAAVALSLSVTEASARDRYEGHVNHGNAPHIRSGFTPSVRQFQSAPNVRYGGQPQVHFRSAGGQPQVHFNNSYRSQPQVHLNGGGPGRVERHVEYRVEHRHHHRLGRPIINFGLPYVYEPGYYANNECYAWQPAMTPYGWRYMWVYVCDDGVVDDLDN
jgi:hypothetical protein